MNKLSQKELSSVLINLMSVKLLLAFPRKLVTEAGSACWILSILITLLSLAVFYIFSKIYNVDENIIEKAEKAGGKPLRIIVGVIITIALSISMCNIARIYPETVKIILLQQTPINIITIIFAIAAIFAAYTGIEEVGRIASLFLPLAVGVATLFLILSVPQLKISNLLPILGKGPIPILKGTKLAIPVFSDIIVLYIIEGNEKCSKKKSGLLSIGLTGLILTIILLAYSLVFPDNISENFIMPLYQLTRIVKIGDYISRLEAFFEFIWSISTMLYFSTYLYALSIVWQKTFNLKYNKPLILPFMIIIIFLSTLGESMLSYEDLHPVYIVFLGVVAIIIPIILQSINKIKGEKIEKND